MKKKKKILIFVNDLSFFISHRLPVAEASFNKGFEVTILYGELGGANLNFLRKKGFKLKYIPIKMIAPKKPFSSLKIEKTKSV